MQMTSKTKETRMEDEVEGCRDFCLAFLIEGLFALIGEMVVEVETLIGKRAKGQVDDAGTNWRWQTPFKTIQDEKEQDIKKSEERMMTAGKCMHVQMKVGDKKERMKKRKIERESGTGVTNDEATGTQKEEAAATNGSSWTSWREKERKRERGGQWSGQEEDDLTAGEQSKRKKNGETRR